MRSQPSLFESLESRRMMDAVPPLVINGTAGHDDIVLVYNDRMATLTMSMNGSQPAWVALPAGAKIQVNGLAGNDRIRFSNIVYRLFSGFRGAELNGGTGMDTLFGGSGADTLNGGDHDDVLDGGGAADLLNGGFGFDTADYSARTAGLTLRLDGAANDGQAGEGDNIASDIETLKGGAGNDLIIGDSYSLIARQFLGNGGNDTMLGGPANETLIGGDGNDMMAGSYGNDVLRGGAGDDLVAGNEGNDILYADSGLDTLFGDAGDDRLFGGRDADNLGGGDGNDVLVAIGGGQFDVLSGDAGLDNFWLDAEASEQVSDATSAESKNVHRVASFTALRVNGVNAGTPSRELLGQSLPDPTSAWPYANYRNNPLFASSGPSANDIKQGNVGDCYFVAPLSAVAKTAPHVIRRTVADLGDGTYAVHFRKDGADHFVRVDADLPTRASTALAYAGVGAQGSTWVAIIEKAFAFFRKNRGTYDSIAAGWPSETHARLGMSSDHAYPHVGFNPNPATFMADVKHLLDRGDAVTLATTSSGGVLEGSHAYMVDSIFTDATGGLCMRLRNPWASDGSGGDANDDGYVVITASEAFVAAYNVTAGRA